MHAQHHCSILDFAYINMEKSSISKNNEDIIGSSCIKETKVGITDIHKNFLNKPIFFILYNTFKQSSNKN